MAEPTEPGVEPEFTTYTEDPYTSGAENPTISSSSPAITLGKQKAVVAAIAGAAVGLGTSLAQAALDGQIDLGEVWVIIGAVLAGAGLTGGATYQKSTSVHFNS